MSHLVKRKRGPISKEEWSAIYTRETWLRDYREARITRGHSGTAADAAYKGQSHRHDSLAWRQAFVDGRNIAMANGFTGRPPAEDLAIVLKSHHRWTDSPNLPEWW